MWLSLFAIFHDVYSYIHHKIKVFSYWIEGSPKYYLTYDEQVVPYRVPHSSIYCPVNNVIYSGEHKHAKKKRLPWLSLFLKWNEVHSLDLSDWMSELRVTSEYPSLVQIIRLASQVHRVHIPELPTTEVHVVNRSGEDEVYGYNGNVSLVKTENS